MRDELQRIRWGPEPGQPIGGIGTVRIIVRASSDAEVVLAQAKELLEIIVSQPTEPFPSLDQWRQILPAWFLAVCAPEPTPEELELLRTMSPEEEERHSEGKWSLDAFVYWFEPINRFWRWWDAIVTDDCTMVVAIEVSEWPFPWGSLKWLLTAAGAETVKAED